MPAVYPRCRLGRIQVYVSADGYCMPCCWIGNHPELGMLRDFLGSDFEQLSIHGRTKADVDGSDAMRRIEGSWEHGTLQPCVDFCGEPFRDDENHFRDYELWVDLAGIELEDEQEDPAP